MATVVRTSDADLLLRLRTRDREAWEELYAEYQPRLRAFGYRLSGNAHDADDLVQETFVRAVPRLDRLDPETADIGAYLFTTLRNLFLKQVERTKRQQPVAEVPEPVLPTPIEDDPERGTLLRSQQDEVRVANSRLQPRQRLVLALRELEDRSYAEIGALVGMKENAVAQLIFRARESLRVELRLAQVDPERLPEECRRYLPLLAAHLDGQLKGARQEETLAHLDACDRCQDALASMREASKRYRTLYLPGLLDAEEARAEVERRLDVAHYWDLDARRRIAGVTARTGAVVAVALALGGGGTALGVALSQDEEPPADPRRAIIALASTGSESATTEPAAVVTTVRAATTARKPRRSAPRQTPAPPPSTAPRTGTSATSTVSPPTTTAPVETTRPRRVVPPQPQKPETEQKPETVTTPKPDTKAPTVTITRAPSGLVAIDSVQIAFRASEAGATFSCRLDDAAYAACTSPRALAGLSAGAHVFSVRAADKAGNIGNPASVAWTYTPPDTTPPAVTIASAPPASTTETSATFTFTGSEPGVGFECSLDGAAYAACASPASYGSLAVAAHSFAVRGRDAAGNVSQPATHAWSVVAPPRPLPDLVIASFTKNTITIANRGNAAAGSSVLTITLVGTFTVPALQPGAVATFNWSICRVGTYSAIVDRTNTVTESDERNNTTSRANTCP